MALYLVQHAKSLPRDQDPRQGLSSVGIDDANRIARVAKGYHVTVSCIKHSGKQRARETAEIMGTFLEPENGIVEIEGLKPMDDVAVLGQTLDSLANMMLVGHLPFMERLTAYLVTGSWEKSIFKFQNAGIVCLDKTLDTDSWIIRWSLMPNIGKTTGPV
jgi:phosphohistidine phosphatase